MKWKYILISVLLVFVLAFTFSEGRKTLVVGSPPIASTPYHILDYTKPEPKP